ncbi:MAG TPA: M48 family metalloprotease [Gaiellaceae bacterium]|nr:M48 family metalloprotease [Gaiellaceae bacterium]
MSRRAVRAAPAAALAAVWALAAWWLWRTSVPGSLHLPHLDEHRFFSASQLHAAASFSRFGELTWAGGSLCQLAVLAVYARYGARFSRESAAGPIGTGMLLGMLGFALVWLAELPFGVADLWWQRRHHVSYVGYVDFLFGDWLALAAQFLFLCLALAIVMGLARLVGRWWWLPAAPLFVGVALLFAFVTPWLLPTHRLDDPSLRAAAVRLEAKEGVSRTPVVVQDVRDVTSLPNAEAAGLGPSRRIVLFDTLLDGRFTEPELRVVVAHEAGHVARGHIWKSVGWYALFAFPGTFLLALAVRRRGGMGEAAAIPLALLVLVVLGLLALPFQNAISRHMEAEADWRALVTTRDPAAAVGLFRRFVPTTLDDPNPSTLDYVLFENHPTLLQRIAMAKAYERYAAGAAQSP